MKITIENTDRIVQIQTPDGRCMIPARVWEGKTESGIFVQCLVTRIAAPAGENLDQFARELTETRPPQVENVFPLRMIL